MGRPVDAAAVFVDTGGSMNVVEGRGRVYVYDPAKNPKGPQSVESAFVRGDMVFVIDSGKKSWAYSIVNGTWTPGVTLEAAEDQAEEAWKNVGDLTAVGPPEEPEPA